MSPINLPRVNTQKYIVPFVAWHKTVKTFDGLNHQYAPEEYPYQVDAHMMFTMGEQPFDPVACIQLH